MRVSKLYDNELLLYELRHSFDFFWKEANSRAQSKGYGLIRDKSMIEKDIASISSVGYGLAAIIIGINRHWITYEEGYKRVNGTLDTFLHHVEGCEGFFYHFVNMKTGKREWNSELSIIDTAIFICGALTSGEFFKGEIKRKAKELYQRINWNWYLNKETNEFYMGYTPEEGFTGKWDMYAEQLMLYVLATSSVTFPITTDTYKKMKKPRGEYKDIKDIIYTYCGTLFTYQYSHAWIDFRNTKDEEGIDWFENSIKATKANRQYCIDLKNKYRTFHENSWGLTACLGPNGYGVDYGTQPCEAEVDKYNDGTVATSGAEGSIVFLPEECIQALEYYYNNIPKLWGKYGFRNAYNDEGKKTWFSKEYIGIDKGISMLMIENYLSGMIWNLFMTNEYVKNGMKKIGIHKKIEEKVTTKSSSSKHK